MEHVETLVQTAETTHREPRRPQAVPGGQASSPSGEGRKDTLCLPNTPLDLGVYRDHCDLGAERALLQPIVLREPPASLLSHTKFSLRLPWDQELPLSPFHATFYTVF